MSSLRASAPVSQMTGASATFTVSSSRGIHLAGAEVLVAVRPSRGVLGVVAVHQVDPAGDGQDPLGRGDQLLTAARAWQVSRQNPMPMSPMWSQSRAMVSKWRAIAWSPPAVFSRYTGTSVSRSMRP